MDDVRRVRIRQTVQSPEELIQVAARRTVSVPACSKNEDCRFIATLGRSLDAVRLFDDQQDGLVTLNCQFTVPQDSQDAEDLIKFFQRLGKRVEIAKRPTPLQRLVATYQW